MGSTSITFLASLLLLFMALDTTATMAAVDHTELNTYVTAYAAGKSAYTGGRWHECIAYMQAAVQLFKRHQDDVLGCRAACHRRTRLSEPLISAPAADEDDGGIFLYESAIRNALCLLTCQRKTNSVATSSSARSRAFEESILDRRPYEYLQLCYYKAIHLSANPRYLGAYAPNSSRPNNRAIWLHNLVHHIDSKLLNEFKKYSKHVGDLLNAISSAYTFLLQNPNHKVMNANFRFYASQPEVQLQLVRNLEEQPYQELFLRGNDAYNKKDYAEVVSSIEAALEHNFQAEDRCRLQCEGSFERGPLLDLTMTVANHFTYSLRCKQRCSTKLALVYGEQYDDFLPSHFHYLQFAYYKIGQTAKACEAVATHLIFHPDNKVMLHNKKFYAQQLGTDPATEDPFKPRKVVVDYVRRDKDEKRLLAFIETHFDMAKSEASTTNPRQSKPTSNVPSMNIAALVSKNVTLTMRDTELKGTNRFTADGLADSRECHQLIQLAMKAAVHGDGYDGNTSPHSRFESFEGLTIGRAASLVSMGLLEKERLRLLMDVSERGRAYVEHHFRLDPDRLHFSYTHLVCRAAHSNSPSNRSDLSHPVHADNCMLQSDRRCLKKKPAYTWRDYSAILYLNDNFDGGEFLFAKNQDDVEATVTPACGRLVGFSAGPENTHGVRAVRRGRRCALAMWFTLDAKHRERERIVASHMLATQFTEPTASKIASRPSSTRPTETEIRNNFHLHNKQLQELNSGRHDLKNQVSFGDFRKKQMGHQHDEEL